MPRGIQPGVWRMVRTQSTAWPNRGFHLLFQNDLTSKGMSCLPMDVLLTFSAKSGKTWPGGVVETSRIVVHDYRVLKRSTLPQTLLERIPQLKPEIRVE